MRARTKAALARRILDKTVPKPSHSMVGDVVMQRICAHKKKVTLADGAMPCQPELFPRLIQPEEKLG